MKTLKKLSSIAAVAVVVAVCLGAGASRPSQIVLQKEFCAKTPGSDADSVPKPNAFYAARLPGSDIPDSISLNRHPLIASLR